MKAMKKYEVATKLMPNLTYLTLTYLTFPSLTYPNLGGPLHKLVILKKIEKYEEASGALVFAFHLALGTSKNILSSQWVHLNCDYL